MHGEIIPNWSFHAYFPHKTIVYQFIFSSNEAKIMTNRRNQGLSDVVTEEQVHLWGGKVLGRVDAPGEFGGLEKRHLEAFSSQGRCGI